MFCTFGCDRVYLPVFRTLTSVVSSRSLFSDRLQREFQQYARVPGREILGPLPLTPQHDQQHRVCAPLTGSLQAALGEQWPLR